MGASIAAGLRLFAYLVLTLCAMPLQALAVATGLCRKVLPRPYHRLCAWLIGFRLQVRGKPVSGRPVMFISNHVSYLDITILGALIRGSFVAKSEVAGWPFFGTLAKLQETVFIERKNRHGVGRQADDIKGRLEAGDSLILFPEGTSSDGNRTLPFKTALFAVAGLKIDGKPLTVQPVSIAATRIDDLPMGLIDRPLYAWYGDMDLAPHLWQVFKAGRITVEVEFHPPVTLADFSSRKALAEHCWQEVAGGVSRAISGRPRSDANATVKGAATKGADGQAHAPA